MPLNPASQRGRAPIELATAAPEHPLYETLQPGALTLYLHRLTGRTVQPLPRAHEGFDRMRGMDGQPHVEWRRSKRDAGVDLGR